MWKSVQAGDVPGYPQMHMRGTNYLEQTGEEVMVAVLDNRARIQPFERDLDMLHDAICEGRRHDAVELLRQMFPDYGLRSLREQANLFPGRVEA